jgi:hypothetical protein
MKTIPGCFASALGALMALALASPAQGLAAESLIGHYAARPLMPQAELELSSLEVDGVRFPSTAEAALVQSGGVVSARSAGSAFDLATVVATQGRTVVLQASPDLQIELTQTRSAAYPCETGCDDGMPGALRLCRRVTIEAHFQRDGGAIELKHSYEERL